MRAGKRGKQTTAARTAVIIVYNIELNDAGNRIAEYSSPMGRCNIPGNSIPDDSCVTVIQRDSPAVYTAFIAGDRVSLKQECTAVGAYTAAVSAGGVVLYHVFRYPAAAAVAEIDPRPGSGASITGNHIPVNHRRGIVNENTPSPTARDAVAAYLVVDYPGALPARAVNENAATPKKAWIKWIFRATSIYYDETFQNAR